LSGPGKCKLQTKQNNVKIKNCVTIHFQDLLFQIFKSLSKIMERLDKLDRKVMEIEKRQNEGENHMDACLKHKHGVIWETRLPIEPLVSSDLCREQLFMILE